MSDPQNKKNIFSYYVSRLPALISEIFYARTARLPGMDYDQYWRAKGEMLFTGRCPVLAGLVKAGTSVLDIGCGDGATLAYLRDKAGVRGRGLDISAEAVARTRQKGIEADKADASARDFQVDVTYDHIIISEVLEHIPNPEELLLKVKGRFKVSLLISIPNSAYYIHRLRLLFGRFPVQWAWHPGEHLRFWSLTDFRELLEESGFSVISVRTHSGFMFMHRLWPNLFADSAIFEVKEK